MATKPTHEELGQRVKELEKEAAELKEAEEALAESEKKYRNVVENAHDGIVIIQDGQLKFVNRRLAQMVGYALEELIDTPFTIYIDPDELPEAVEIYKRRMAGEQLPEKYERGLRHKNGSRIETEIAAGLITYQGKPADFAVIRDITERKRAEEALHKMSEEQALLLDNIDTQVWYLTDMENHGAVNRALAEFLGVQKSDVAHKNMYDILSKEEAEVCIAGNKEVFESKRQIHTEEWVKNGRRELRLLSISKTPKLDKDGNVKYVVCAAEDITERKRMEDQLRERTRQLQVSYDQAVIYAQELNQEIIERKLAEEALQKAHVELEQRVEDRTNELASRNKQLELEITSRKRADEGLRESEQRYRTLFEKTSHPIMVIDTHGNYVQCNEAALRFLECSRDELLSRNVRDFMPPGKYKEVTKEHKALWKSSGVIETEYFVSGKTKLLELTISPATWENNKVVFGVGKDITERKRAEETVRESEERFRAIVEAMPIPVMISRRSDSVILFVNDHFAQLVDLHNSQLIGNKTTGFFYDSADRQIIRNTLQREGSLSSYEFRAKRADGTPFWAVTSSQPLMYRGEEAYVSGFYETSARKQAEEALSESQEKYQLLYDNAVVAMFRTAIEDGKALAANDVGVHLFGYSSKEEFLSQFKASEHYVDPDGRKGLLDALKEGPVNNLHTEFFRKDGSTFWAEFSCKMYLKEGYLEGAVIDITERKLAEEQLAKSNEALRDRTHSLDELNTALKVLLEHREKDKEELEEKVVLNVKELISPYVETLRNTRLDTKQMTCVEIIESNLKEIVSPFLQKLALKYSGFTPKEIQIAGLIKQGKTTKEIAELFNLSPRTIKFHRQNIRAKLGLKNQRTNLASYLLSFP